MEQSSVKKEKKQKKKKIPDSEYHLIVFNDDYNTFDHVINCFIEICRLSPEEAIERTYFIHHNGSGVVKSGPYDELNQMRKKLLDCNLWAIIQDSLNS